MTEDEHILLCLSEECDEVGQRVSKALRFGLNEVQPAQPLTNADRIAEEMRDLISVAILLANRGIIPFSFMPNVRETEAKREKIERFMAISRREGTLSASPANGASHAR